MISMEMKAMPMTNKPDKTLIVILGATATGKTDVSVALATEFGSEILSADSRQIYREIPIGTADPVTRTITGRSSPFHRFAQHHRRVFVRPVRGGCTRTVGTTFPQTRHAVHGGRIGTLYRCGLQRDG